MSHPCVICDEVTLSTMPCCGDAVCSQDCAHDHECPTCSDCGAVTRWPEEHEEGLCWDCIERRDERREREAAVAAYESHGDHLRKERIEEGFYDRD